MAQRFLWRVNKGPADLDGNNDRFIPTLTPCTLLENDILGLVLLLGLEWPGFFFQEYVGELGMYHRSIKESKQDTTRTNPGAHTRFLERLTAYKK